MPQAQRVASRQHPVVARLRRLASRRAGDREVLLDGEHLVVEALAAGVHIDAMLVDRRHGALARRAAAAGAVIYEGPSAVVEAASPVRSPSGVVAIAHWTPAPIGRIFDADPPFVLGLVDVQDPGNLGAAIRAADALEAGGVIAIDRSADPAGWKALRGAMGGTFRIGVARGSLAEAVAGARARGWRIAATAAGQRSTVDSVDLTGPWLVLLGNEGAGLAESARRAADVLLSIPMRTGVESLNVAVTAALIAAEARRQRGGEQGKLGTRF